MPLPTEVQRALERANSYYPQQGQEQGQGGEPRPTNPTPNVGPGFDQAPSNPAPQQQAQTPQGHQQAPQQQPRNDQGQWQGYEQQQAQQAQQQPQGGDQYDEKNDANYWRTRFENLERSYNELERYQGQEAQGLRQQLDQERNQRQQLESQLQQAQQQGGHQGGDYDLSIFSAEEREAYGDDMLKTMMKVSGGQRPQGMGQGGQHQPAQPQQPYAGDQSAPYGQQPQQGHGQAQGQEHQAPRRDAQQEEAAARFYARLAQVTPNHNTINHDPAFLKWLDQPDPATGMVRQEVLNYHAQHGNADKVGEIFNEFDRQANRNAPADMVQPRQRPSSADVSGSGGNNEIWTQAHIDALYRDARKMPPDEFKKWETELFRAQNEGRVQA